MIKTRKLDMKTQIPPKNNILPMNIAGVTFDASRNTYLLSFLHGLR